MSNVSVYTRALTYCLPFMRGEDVLTLQLRLRDLGFFKAGSPDGLFGLGTDQSVRQYQQSNGLTVDGIIGAISWAVLFPPEKTAQSVDKIGTVLSELKLSHGYQNSVLWQMVPTGISIDGKPPKDSGGEPKTVRTVWQKFGKSIETWSEKLTVPAELIIATICTESGGKADSVREEPGYISDDQTPSRVSPGLMQVLISTARDVLGNPTLNRAWLLAPDNSIRAGTAMIASQWKKTHFDPPKVACAYNAGGVYLNEGEENRWKMRQYPINTSHHADRFVQWFNDCFLFFEKDAIVPKVSFYRLLKTK